MHLVGPRPAAMCLYLDRGYDAGLTRARLASRQLLGAIAEQGTPVRLTAGKRWWRAPLPGPTPPRHWSGGPTPGAGGRFPDRFRDGAHHRRPARAPRLDPLPRGYPPTTATMTYWRKLLSTPTSDQMTDRSSPHPRPDRKETTRQVYRSVHYVCLSIDHLGETASTSSIRLFATARIRLRQSDPRPEPSFPCARSKRSILP